MRGILVTFLILGSGAARAEHSLGQWLEDWAEEREVSMAGPGAYGRGADAGGADAGGSAGGDAGAGKTGGEGGKNESSEENAKQEQKEKEDKEDAARLDLKADTATDEQKTDLDNRIGELAERLKTADGEEKAQIQERLQTLTSLRVSLNPPPPVPPAPPPAPPPPPPAAPFIGTPSSVAANDPVAIQQNAIGILQLAPSSPPAPVGPPPAPPAPPPPPRQGGANNVLAGSLSPALPAGPRTTLAKIAPQTQNAGTKSAPAPEQLAQRNEETPSVLRTSGPPPAASQSPALSATLPPPPPPPPAVSEGGRPIDTRTTYTPPQPPPALSPPPPAPVEARALDSDLTLSVVRAATAENQTENDKFFGEAPAKDLPPLPSGRTEAPADSRAFAAFGEGTAPAEDRTTSGRYAAEIRDERPSRGIDERAPEPEPEPEPERKVREIVVQVDPPALPPGYKVPEGLDPDEPVPEAKPRRTDPSEPVKISALPKREIPENLAELKKALSEEDERLQAMTKIVSDLDTFTNTR